MKKHILKICTILFLFICTINYSFAVPPAVDNHIKIDQFGYRTTDKKIAVISNPQIGYNSANTFTPGTTYQVKRWSDDAVMFTGTITAWNGGATHLQSGDKVWWFDFSSFTTPGSYYIFDITNNVRSYQFDINDCVYLTTMKQAFRTYYYQRCGTVKASPYAQTGWTDTPCHIGSFQDTDCRLYSSPTNTATSKNLSGGWHDAGDYNKYVNYTFETMIDLMFAYSENKTVWGDDYNIPESGNGIPDILDEVKYELDWLLKMQNNNGSVLSMVGVPAIGGGGGSPPSADVAKRVYGPATTSAAFTASSLFALGAIQFNTINPTYAATLQTAAINAWNWAVVNPNITFFNKDTIQAGEQEVTPYHRLVRKVAAASFLFALTGNSIYKTFFESNYTQMKLFTLSFAFPDESSTQDMMLYYASLPLATPSVVAAITNAYSNSIQTDLDNFPAYLTNKRDAYRAFLASNNYIGGSNQQKSSQGRMFTNMVTYNLDPPNNNNYKDAAEEFIHYFHGVNPTAFCYLTNMSSFGGENSINAINHGWFTEGSPLWSAVGTSAYGPAPGYMSGGPDSLEYKLDTCCVGSCATNSLCNIALVTPPLNQPPQKSYKDWNNNFPQQSWTVTEPAIYHQASYVKLLSRFLNSSCVTTGIDDYISGNNLFVQVFPNPFTSQTTFLFNSELKNAELKVYDVLGQEIKEVKNIYGRQITINRNNLIDGIYIYRIIQENKIIATGKLIAE